MTESASPAVAPVLESESGNRVPLTVTHILEYLYCPRFPYFEYVLAVPERQERRELVQKGRTVHQERTRINPTYLRKKLGVVERRFDVPMASATRAPAATSRGAVGSATTTRVCCATLSAARASACPIRRSATRSARATPRTPMATVSRTSAT